MEPFRYHVYLCTQEKSDPKAPSCPNQGSKEVLEALRAELAKAGLGDEVQLTTSGSLGLCERGPNMVVYPEGIWYSRVQKADVPEIVNEHFMNNRPVERLMNTDGAALRNDILETRRKMQARKAAEAAQKT
jgi:NADP-reducing hydrogenase subunit HndC